MQKIKITIDGMHCASCEAHIEHRLQKVKGVEKAEVNQAKGTAEIYYSQEPLFTDIDNAVQSAGYRVIRDSERKDTVIPNSRAIARNQYREAGYVFLIVLALYSLFRQFDFSFNTISLSDDMSYGIVFLIGLVAAISTCIAVTGGLLLAVAGKYTERSADLNRFERFKPHLYFNIGRIVSYAFFGGLIGAGGSFLRPSPRATGILMIMISIAMVVLGAQLLHIFPWLRYFRFRMPKFFARRVQGASEKLPNKTAPFFVGASTFFLPCGFTQALQLYALARGSAVTGALVMFVFSLGTLPALVSLGAFSSFIKDSLQRYFLKFSGAIVILVGIVTIQNGFALSGIRFDFIGQFIGKHQLLASTEQTVSGAMRDGTQVIDMTINGLDYFPSRFTVLQGVPVEWRIDGRSAQGCAQVVTIPSLGITEYIPKNTVKVIRFTARETGEIPFFCPMGMTSGDAAFLVVPNQERVIQKKYAVADETFLGKNGECNPEIMNCIPVQKLLMTVTKERGFYPNYFTVKKDIPVELEIDARAPLSGCMSTVVIPEYNVADTLLFGKKTTLRFTPTKEGRSLISCSMGTPMGEVRVIN